MVVFISVVYPYALSLKSNGCIIFIALLKSTKLLITSKHEKWLRKHLEIKGKTQANLATTQRLSDLTAVG